MNGVLPVSKLSQSSTSQSQVPAGFGCQKKPLLPQFGFPKTGNCISKKKNVFIISFSYDLFSIGFKKLKGILDFFMPNKYVGIFAEGRKKECKEKWQTLKFLMNPTAIHSL